jgi:hypothetical protein
MNATRRARSAATDSAARASGRRRKREASWAWAEAGRRGRARAGDAGRFWPWAEPEAAAREGKNEFFDFQISNLNVFQTSNHILNKKKAFYGFGPKIKVARN